MAKTENGIISGSASGTVVEVEGGQNILIDVTSPDLVVFSQDGSDLVITSIADGQKIVLDGFFSQAGTNLPPQLTLADGSVISAAEVTGLVEDFDPGQVAPAAGAPGGGGASFSAFTDAGIGDGIGIDGLLDPTELGFPPNEPIEDLVAIPGQPDLLLNEIGMGTFILGSNDKGQGQNAKAIQEESLFDKMVGENSAAIDSFLEFSDGGAVDFIELRNTTGSAQSTAGNGPSTVGEGVTTISIIGPDGAPVSFDLPTLTIQPGGQLVVLQSVVEGDEGNLVETIYMVFDADGNITSSGALGGVGDWPMGEDTSDPLGVLLSWSLGGDVGEVDTFLANGAQFEPAGLNNGWTGVPEVAVALDIFGDSDTFNGQISTQEKVGETVFDAYAPITMDQLVAEGPLGEDFFHDIDVNNIFSRVDNFDADTAADWTTNQTHTIGLVNDEYDPNPQDPFNDDMNPGQPTGPEPTADEELDNNGQNVIILGDDEDDSDFITEDGVVEGGRAQDFIIGDEGSNTLDGGAHNDFLDGGAGNDLMYGGSGGDVLIDDQGQDLLIGGTGTDILFGRREAGDDMYGGYGNEQFQKIVSDDQMYGGSSEIGDEDGAREYGTGDILIGDEAFVGGSDNDNMYGGNGNVQIPKIAAFDLMYGGGGNDYLDPRDYMRDIIVAGDGDDLIFGDNATLPSLDPNDVDGIIDNFYKNAFETNPLFLADDLSGFIDFYYGGADLIYGGWGNDVIFGQGGDDLILAGHGNDMAFGGSGNDVIRGNSGNDSLYGGYGEDLMYGGQGNDFMMGESGDDTMYGGTGDDWMYGGSGDDVMYGGSSGDRMYGHTGDDTMYGGTGNDYMDGGNDNDLMYGGANNDLMFGQSGDDTMYGGSNDDTMFGGSGNDEMHGGTGADSMRGGIGEDLMYGGSGADQMFGESDDDLMYGGTGEDYLSGQSGDDVMYGGADGDVMSGGNDDDLLYGGSGDDSMFGDSGDDTMYGGSDDDHMAGGSGNDVMHGGADDDTMFGQTGDDLMFGEQGNDLMFGDDGEDTLFGGTGSEDTMFGGADDDVMHGDNGDLAEVGDDDFMYGGSGDDLMYGEGGSDEMYGEAGEDSMFGGAGNDLMYGGTGDDLIKGDAGDDVMYGGDGDDTVWGGSSNNSNDGPNSSGNDLAYLGAGNDIFDDNGQNSGADTVYGGTGNDKVWTGDGDDLIYGEEGDDTLKGESGADTIYGGSGDDELHGQQGNDLMYGGTGNDFMDGGSNDDTMFGGAGNDVMEGGSGADQMHGGTGDDFMEGHAGSDNMFGGDGADTMSGGSGNDSMDGWTGDDVMYGNSGDDTMLGYDGEDTMYGGSGADTMLGESDDDLMYGGADDDTMSGGTGNDEMLGGTGDDQMSGGSGNDDMDGGVGDDVMYGGADDDFMDGWTGDDVMYGGTGEDILLGFDGADAMYGGAGADEMYGESDDDFMLGGSGDDDMSGGTGDDFMGGGSGDDAMNGGSGDDEMHGGSGNDEMSGGTGDDVMFGDGDDDIMYGNTGDDDMSGGAGADLMYGGAGNDEMSGGAGNDLMFGGTGSSDTLFGDGGNDVMYGDNGDLAEVGDDDFMYGGAGSDNMFGEGGDDVMYGGADNDTLDGNAGSDQVNGDAGDDVLRWTMTENEGATDNYDGGADTDTLELHFTAAQFADYEAEIAKFANDVEDFGSGTLTIEGRTLNASNIEYVAVHVDGVEVPVLIDDEITTDENTDVTQQITADPNTQDFIPNAQTTTFGTPGAVTLTVPLGGEQVFNFAASDWNQVGDVWTLDLVDGTDNYGQLIVDATNPEAVTATLDIPDAADSAWEPMDDGQVATAVFDYSASVDGSEGATVTINVNGVNDAPVAVDDIVITNVLGDIYVPNNGVLANDTDIDELDELSVSAGVTSDEDGNDKELLVDDNYIMLPGYNRVDNGSFEELGDDVNVDHGNWGTYNSLPGWNVDTDTNNGGSNAPIEIQEGGTGGINAQDGNNKMEIDSHNEGGYTSSNAHVYQDIPTTEGEELTLSFWYSPRTTTSTNDVQVWWNGELLTTLSGTIPEWQEFTFEVDAAEGEEMTRLEFRGLPQEDTLGGYIDNVYVGDRDFDYTATDGNASDDAHVDVQYQVGNQLQGGEENEIIIGGDDADTIRGGDGDDTLIGGGGDDILFGDEGDDEYHFGYPVGAGETEGDDTIIGFEEGDTINLDTLFDALGIAVADRADDVTLTKDGANTVITVEGQDEFSITVNNVDLGEGGFTAEELAAKGVIVSDES